MKKLKLENNGLFLCTYRISVRTFRLLMFAGVYVHYELLNLC